jgi:hypothetical protein
MGIKWIECEKEIPYISDRSVLAFFSETQCIDVVHVEDYFEEIPAGFDSGGNQKYTKWYLTQRVTHWMELPDAPL